MHEFVHDFAHLICVTFSIFKFVLPTSIAPIMVPYMNNFSNSEACLTCYTTICATFLIHMLAKQVNFDVK